MLNGLQIMQGHAEIVEATDDDLVSESGRALTKQVDTLTELLEEVRAVSNVLLDEAEPEPIDLLPVLDDAVETANESLLDATVETDLPDTLEAVDTLALKPVFTTLLNNAVQHSADDPTIRVTGHRDGDRVVVTVADDGPGVLPVERDRIFERGVTSDGGDGGLASTSSRRFSAVPTVPSTSKTAISAARPSSFRSPPAKTDRLVAAYTATSRCTAPEAPSGPPDPVVNTYNRPSVSRPNASRFGPGGSPLAVSRFTRERFHSPPSSGSLAVKIVPSAR